jgi:hypothetical protein
MRRSASAVPALPTAGTLEALLADGAPTPPDVPGAPCDGYPSFTLLPALGPAYWACALVLRGRHQWQTERSPR